MPRTDDDAGRGPGGIDWPNVRRVLVVRLRSIGDTVLATPSLAALKKFLPHARIDILLEDWVAPVLAGFEDANVIPVGRAAADRLRVLRKIRHDRYDVVFNLHGGTTATFFTGFSGARHRVGYSEYQYSFLYNHLLSSASDFWKKPLTHSAEQQLALLGFAGVPVEPAARTHLNITSEALRSVDHRLADSALGGTGREFALIHPVAAFETKTWAVENFARAAEFLAERGLAAAAVATGMERGVLERLAAGSSVPIATFDDLSLPEISALASRARLFVGNDSGIAHIAAAVGTPSVVVFGSSNVNHWRPWTDAANEIVHNPLPCHPCPGYVCEEFGEPRCIREIPVNAVTAAIGRVLEAK